MKERRQPPRAARCHNRGRRCVVGMRQVPAQENAQRPGGLLFLRAADFQEAGIAGAGRGSDQLQHAAGVGAAPVALVAEDA